MTQGSARHDHLADRRRAGSRAVFERFDGLRDHDHERWMSCASQQVEPVRIRGPGAHAVDCLACSVSTHSGLVRPRTYASVCMWKDDALGAFFGAEGFLATLVTAGAESTMMS